ncbi:ammonium transporter AmtB-like domain-containing protein [Dunaliella salina]|uniref:Ammonium transporter AmtB-like domain-containing protein n=1 Tax=Dunaliella salina TaxID=3046 RepID=A0ABQ7FVG7_DUNSA|nr:ammonium transporter AmtB-like domain-containing protein [Dunaliella salina]|eukprot:KAF5826379.1 ammonium transporter AmtB-like domain-containing protein [Dunaliella salina]
MAGNCSEAQYEDVLRVTASEQAASAVCALDVATLGVQNAVLQWTVSRIQAQEERAKEMEYGMDTSFLLMSAYQVFLMQAGFALYAAGVVRAKNIAMELATIVRANAGVGFIGHSDFALQESEENNPTNYAYWFWNWAFSAAATTILSGSIAERATFHAYLMYSFFMTIFVYPVVSHWMWSEDGWLNPHNPRAILGSGAIDFAGTSVVHLMGGFASMVGSLATGPRTGRFDSLLPRSAFKGGSPALYVLGTFLLWFGWYGFNPGSFLGVHNHHLAEGVSRTAVCTTLSTGTAAIFTLFLAYGRTHTWDLLSVRASSSFYQEVHHPLHRHSSHLHSGHGVPLHPHMGLAFGACK